MDRATLEKIVHAKLRVLKHLPQEGDLSLVVLKGHLLIEELLVILVESSVKYPEALRSANLRFHTLASIAKALFYTETTSFIWDGIFALNVLRNAFAHNLQPRDLDDKINQLGRAWPGGNRESEKDAVSIPKSEIGGIIEFMCGSLMGLLASTALKDDSDRPTAIAG